MNGLHIDRIEKSSDIPSVWGQAREAFGAYGIDNVIYLTIDPEHAAPFVLSTCPDIYNDWAPASDPWLVHCCNSYEFTRTGTEYLSCHPDLSQAERDFIKRAAACGFRSGLGIPVRLQGSGRYGGFNLGTGLDRAEFEAQVIPHAEALRLICLLAHRRIEELSEDAYDATNGEFRDLLVAPATIGDLHDLSPREREVIYLVARGLSRKETARLCGISPHTVGDYVKSAYRKLGVSNRAEAAALVFGQDA